MAQKSLHALIGGESLSQDSIESTHGNDNRSQSDNKPTPNSAKSKAKLH